MDVTETTHMSKAKHILKWLCWIWTQVQADNNPAICAIILIQYLPSLAQSTSSSPSSYNFDMCDLIENSSITKTSIKSVSCNNHSQQNYSETKSDCVKIILLAAFRIMDYMCLHQNYVQW